MKIDRDTLQLIANWLAGDDTGLSSKFLAQLALGNPLPDINYPHDPSNFGRCYRFLDRLNNGEQREVLRLAAHRSKEWQAIVENWDELVALFEEEREQDRAPKLYKKMKDIGL